MGKTATNFVELDSATFRRRILGRVLAAMILVPGSGILIMTYLGVYPWPDLLWVLVEYSGLVVVGNTLLVLKLTAMYLDRAIAIAGSDDIDKKRLLAKEMKTYLAPIFFGFLVIYAGQGAISANLSLEHFHGYDYHLDFYLLTFFSIIPTLLITAFPIYFSITDQMGQYLAPRKVQSTIAPLSVKYTILGLFTPLLIDTVLLLYYYDRTRYLTYETLGLWSTLIVLAAFGTLLAWRSMMHSLLPMQEYLKEIESKTGLRSSPPTPQSLDEIGAITSRYAEVLHRNQEIESDLAYERLFVNAVIENANALVVVLDREGKIVRFNEACEKLSGFSFDEVKGGFVWDYLLDPEEAETVRKNAFDVLASNPQSMIGNYTNSWISKGRQRYLIEWSNSLLLDGSGDMDYMVSIGIDITEKQKAENALVENFQQQKSLLMLSQKLEAALNYEELYEILAEEIQSTTGIGHHWLFIRNDAGQSACEVFGELPQILASAGINIDPAGIDMNESFFLKQLQEANDIVVVEDAELDQTVRKDVVQKLGVRSIIHIPFTVENKWQGMFGMATMGHEGIHEVSTSEMTYLKSIRVQVSTALDRIRLVRELRIGQQLLEERVEERTRELKEAQTELLRRERLSTLGQLTATVSHELRNPLGAMRPSTFLIRRKYEDDPVTVRALDRIERSIERCDHIIDELLDFTRITKLELSHQELDRWLAEVLREQRLPGDLVVRLHRGLDGFQVDFDPHRLRRALINIIDNAAQSLVSETDGAVAADANIELTTRVHDGRVEIVLQDNGPGIAPEVLPKIFEPLYSTKNFGVGLGMPTVRQIMEQHAGGIDVESTPGEGTTVTLWLPVNAPTDTNALH